MEYISESPTIHMARTMFGRRVIYSSVSEVTKNNVLDVLTKALTIHSQNKIEIDYLYQYYKGNQPVLNRTKTVRAEINNKIVVNIANQIVSFKTGYLCGEPIQYVSRSEDSNIVESINKLNEMLFSEDKHQKDQEIIEWDMICGTAYRLILPDPSDFDDDAPFEIYTLDPRYTFVVYSNMIGNKPLMAVKSGIDSLTGDTYYSIYTDREFFYVKDTTEIISVSTHNLGSIPIIEYPANNARLGSFETVLTLMDAINTIESSRVDEVEQEVQAFLKFINCDIDEEKLAALKEMGAIRVKSTDGQVADVEYVSTSLNQDQSQTAKDDLYESIYTICGLPNRNGGTSTSDTGAAVELRDGWTDAESRAKDSENIFKCSEKAMLVLILRIVKEIKDADLRLKDIDIRFTRRNYENIQSKAQVLISMLNNPKIHPLLAYMHCGMFPDAESAYSMSMDYYEQELKREANSNADDESDENKESLEKA